MVYSYTTLYSHLQKKRSNLPVGGLVNKSCSMGKKCLMSILAIFWLHARQLMEVKWCRISYIWGSSDTPLLRVYKSSISFLIFLSMFLFQLPANVFTVTPHYSHYSSANLRFAPTVQQRRWRKKKRNYIYWRISVFTVIPQALMKYASSPQYQNILFLLFDSCVPFCTYSQCLRDCQNIR